MLPKDSKRASVNTTVDILLKAENFLIFWTAINSHKVPLFLVVTYVALY
jgi:hypothetical protein